MPELYITNFNKNFTGVSATAAGVARAQLQDLDLALVGRPLPDLPEPISTSHAFALSRTPPPGKPFSIWHVRRNTEMRAALWARDVLRRPIRIVFTSAAQRRHSAFPRWLISRMDAVIATTDAAAALVPNVHAVVEHGVDTTRFHPAPDRDAAWRGLGYPGRIGIATVGRIRPEKGTDLFVEAMLRILPDVPDATALVVGKASREHQAFEAGLKTRVAEAGLSDRILFPGEIAPEDTPALLRATSLIVNLPRYEGYGMVPLEAMASGTPFVATETGHYRAFSAQGTTGMVVPLEDTEAARGAVLRFLSERDTHADAATKGRRLAVDAYSTQREAHGINAVYEKLWRAG